MKFCIEIFKDFKSFVIECGFFPAVLMFIVMVPLFIISIIFYPFEVFNDWSKTWFKE